MQRNSTLPTIASLDDLVKMISKSGKTEADFKLLRMRFQEYYSRAHMEGGNIGNNKLQLLYDLYNGHGYKIRKNRYGKELALIAKSYGLSNPDKLRNFDFLGRTCRHMVGEMRSFPWTARAFDQSRYSSNAIKEENQNQVIEYLRQSVYAPYEKKATQMVQEKYGLQDIFSLGPEEQSQIQEEISQTITEITPEAIIDYMTNKYRSPYEIEGQKLLDLMEADTDIRFLTVENYKHFCISGMQAYKLGTDFREPLVKMLNPANCNPFMKDTDMFFEKGDAFVYKEQLSLNEFFTLYYNKLDTVQRKHLLSNFQTVTGASTHFMNELNNKLIVMGQNASGAWDIDIETQKGQMQMQGLVAMLSNNDLNGLGTHAYITRTHMEVVFNRYLYELHRYNKNTDQIDRFYIGEDYKLNPAEGDIQMVRGIYPVVWEATCLGNGTDLMIDLRPVKGQFTNIDNPWDCSLSYYGGYVSRLMGNTKNTSPMMQGLPYQIRHDILKSQFDDEQKRNIGTALLMFEKLVPEKWTTADVAEALKEDRVLLLNPEEAGVTPDLLSHIRTLNFSNAADLQRLSEEAYTTKMEGIEAMGYNPNRLGTPSPYVSGTMNAQNIQNSSLQTMDLQAMHFKIVENVLNGMFNRAPYYYKGNEARVKYMRTDFMNSLTEINWDKLSLGVFGIRITNNVEDFQDIQAYKQTVIQRAISQNAITDYELALLMFSRTPAQIMAIGEKIHKRLMAQQKEQENLKTQLEQMKIQAMQDNQQKLLDHQTSMNLDKLMVEKYKADQNSEVLAKGFDINQDNVNDQIEKERETRASEEKIAEGDRQLKEFLETRQQDIIKALGMKKLEIDKVRADAAMIAAKKPRTSSK